MVLQDPRIDFDKLPENTKKQVLEQIVNRKLIAKNAIKNGIEKDPQYVEAISVIKEDLALQVWQKNEVDKLKFTEQDKKDFYEDHIKRYKKRPIYWMVSSPKKGFMSLSYMHRYTTDLFARVQNNYLREYITKLEGTVEVQKQTILNEMASNKDKTDADKRIKAIDTKLKELISFDVY